MKKITVSDIMMLMSYAAHALAFEMDDDSFIQFVNNDTGAHYRMKDGKILLGGEYTELTLAQFNNLTVVSIEYNNNHCELWIEG